MVVCADKIRNNKSDNLYDNSSESNSDVINFSNSPIMDQVENLQQTEKPHKLSTDLDLLGSHNALNNMLNAHLQPLNNIQSTADQIEKAANAIANAISKGNNIGYAAAGSSGFMALSDALELPGTFGINKDQIKILLAGGIDFSNYNDKAEDNQEAALNDFEKSLLKKGDVIICISASGTTPYSIDIMKLAKAKGLVTIGIANNFNTELLKIADIDIFLDTSNEIIAGSTRLAAATAQKITLNMISTLVGIKLGHVYDGYMVNLKADNKKLVKRAINIISAISKCEKNIASNLLQASNGSVKEAILISFGVSAEEAKILLLKANGNLRSAISLINKDKTI